LFVGTIRSRPEIIFWEVLYAGVPDAEFVVLQSGCHPAKPLTWFGCSIREYMRTIAYISYIYITSIDSSHKFREIYGIL
jgi:hypothetical protein